MRRCHRAGAKNDLALGMLLRAVLTFLKAHGDGAAFFASLQVKDNVKYLNVGLHRQVRPAHHGMQESCGSTASFTFPLCNLILAETLLLRSVEVWIARETCLFGGLNECLRKRIGTAKVGDV